MSEVVPVHKDGPVTTISLNRPEVRNAVDRPTAEALAEAFRDFDRDEGASVAVLRGEGGTFCAGADLRSIGKPEGNRIEPEGDGPMGVSRLHLSKPVIAAVEGYAVAGGLELALWADLRVAGEGAIFGVFCRRWGLPLVDGGTVRLPRLIGRSHAMDLILTGRPVDAEEAVRIGLVNRKVPVGASTTEAQRLAAELAAFPQICLRQDRMSLLEQEGLSEEEALRNEFRRGTVSFAEGTFEGADRFVAGAGRHGAFTDAGGGSRHEAGRNGSARS